MLSTKEHPGRVLIAMTAIENLGLGLYTTIEIIYFVRVLHFSAPIVTTTLTVVGLATLFVATPIGHVADRHDARVVLAASLVIESLAVLGLGLSTTVWQFAVAISAVTVAERGAYGARGAIIGSLFTATSRVATLARMRVAMNVGIAFGAAAAAVVLTSHVRWPYEITMAGYAMLLTLSAMLTKALPRREGMPGGKAARSSSLLRRTSYVRLVITNALINLHTGVLHVGVPLWITSHTHLPASAVALFTVLNTGLVIGFQSKLAKDVSTVPKALRIQRAGCALLAVGILLIGATSLGDRPLEFAMGLVGVVVYSFGEILQSASAWTLSYELTPPDAGHGAAQSFFGTGVNAAYLSSPALWSRVVALGGLGWVVSASVLAATGLSFGKLVPLHVSAPQVKNEVGTCS